MPQGLPGPLNIAQPTNRRGHSATYFIDKHNTEWMIVSGGFTDEDWHSLPVWAYDLTSGKEIMEGRNDEEDDMSNEEVQNEYADGDEVMELYEHPWVSMVFGGGEDGLPQGRVGHLSSTYNDCLYIFGGLNGSNNSATPVIVAYMNTDTKTICGFFYVDYMSVCVTFLMQNL